jgi:cytochrome c553
VIDGWLPDKGATQLSRRHARKDLKVILPYPGTVSLIVRLMAMGCLLVATTTICNAGDVKAGRAKALMCQTCHGLDGLSKVPDAPNIAGQTEPYLIAQLQAFKSGTRKNDAMSVVAPSLSDTDIDNLAAYFSAIEISVVKIPGQ